MKKIRRYIYWWKLFCTEVRPRIIEYKALYRRYLNARFCSEEIRLSHTKWRSIRAGIRCAMAIASYHTHCEFEFE